MAASKAPTTSSAFLGWAEGYLKEDHGDEYSPSLAVDDDCRDKDMVAVDRWGQLVRNSGTAGVASASIGAAITANHRIWQGTSKPPLYHFGNPHHHGVMNTRTHHIIGTWAAGSQGGIPAPAGEAVSS